jgi:hypothetical protein
MRTYFATRIQFRVLTQPKGEDTGHIQGRGPVERTQQSHDVKKLVWTGSRYDRCRQILFLDYLLEGRPEKDRKGLVIT